MNPTAYKFYFSVLIAAGGLSACGSTKIRDISGMAPISTNQYLIVHDVNNDPRGDPKATRLGRLTLITGEDKGYIHKPVKLKTSAGEPVWSNDLESACPLKGRNDEFLIAEAGTFEKKYGELFHIKLNGETANVLHRAQAVFTADNDRNNNEGDQYEGLACISFSSAEYIIFHGERGGTGRTPDGIIRVGIYDANQGKLSWTGKEYFVQTHSPLLIGATKARAITSLTIDDQDYLWAAAAVDLDNDFGPFRSIVYQLGHVQKDKNNPLNLSIQPAKYIIDGFKVEALAIGKDDKGMSVGTDDEHFGGIWRQLHD